MSTSGLAVLTIGHSNHDIARFVELLRMNGVTALADVRSAPSSRFHPQFNKKSLAESLKATGIAYVFLGKELGARSSDPTVYVRGRVEYEKLAQTTLFRAGIARLEEGAANHRIALMCAEKDPLDCHRTLLVGRALELAGVAVLHILADGTLEPNHAAMRRLLAAEPTAGGDMFDSEERLIELAVAKRAREVAYQDESIATEDLEEAS